MVERDGGVGHAPHHGGPRPHEQLEVGAGEGDPEPLGFLRKEPGIADVAVEGRLEIEEEEADLAHTRAVVLAGQAVGALVGDDDDKHGRPRDEQGLNAVQALDVLGDVSPVGDGEPDGEEHERRRERHEMRGEEEPQPADQAVEHAIRVERLQSQVERVAPDSPGGRRRENPGAPLVGQ